VKGISDLSVVIQTPNALGGRALISNNSMGGIPKTFYISGEPDYSRAVAITGDLTDCDIIRAFWQATIGVLEQEPPELWLNLTKVAKADTKLAACVVALIRRADECGTIVHIIGSAVVQDVLNLCKVPPLREFTLARIH
jgi:ABC-type transporter Mla MlaB component